MRIVFFLVVSRRYILCTCLIYEFDQDLFACLKAKTDTEMSMILLEVSVYKNLCGEE